MRVRRYRRRNLQSTPQSTQKAALWWVLWRDDKAAANELCDKIVRERPIPPTLLEDIAGAPLLSIPPTPAQEWARKRGIV